MIRFYNKFRNTISHFYFQINPTNTDKKFVTNLKSRSINIKSSDYWGKNILLQMPEDYFYFVTFTSAAKYFLNKGANINWININSDYQKVGSTYFLKKVLPYGLKWSKLYLSIGGKEVLNFDFGLFRWIKYSVKSLILFTKLRSKEQLLKIEINNIVVGDLIYDSYLRYRERPTVDICDLYLLRLLHSAFYIFDSTKIYFERNKIDYLITSYTAYLHHGIPVRLALNNGVKVYSAGAYELLFKKVSLTFPYHLKDFSNYNKDVNNYSKSKFEVIIKEASSSLNSRLNGESDTATPYMKTSSYLDSNFGKVYFEGITNNRIVIFIHDFYDSPHVRRWLLFADFYEWFIFILNSYNKNYNYYVKLHPNSSIETINIVSGILSNYPDVKLIPLEVTSKQLVSEGFLMGITNHGTVAHELPLFGIPVLCSGDNPHITFDFCVTSNSLVEFYELLRNPILVKTRTNWVDINKSIYSFYAIHYIDVGSSILSKSQIHFLNSLRKILNFTDWKNYVSEFDSIGIQHIELINKELNNFEKL